MEYDKQPFIVTGASTSGKTTLIEHAINDGYTHIPTHTTRAAREGEIGGVHGVYLTEQQFTENFHAGIYLEPSLDFAKLQSLGIYYGTPTEEIKQLRHEAYCATPVSVEIAKRAISLTDASWIHLVCNDVDRRNRLLSRGITLEEVEWRMTSGDSINVPRQAQVLNTSEMDTESVYKYITAQEL